MSSAWTPCEVDCNEPHFHYFPGVELEEDEVEDEDPTAGFTYPTDR